MTELRAVPKERMTGTRSTEGVITRSGTALHRHLSASRGCWRTSCICFQASCKEAREPETGKSCFPERKELGLPSFSRASHGGAQGPPSIEAAKGSASFFINPVNPKLRKQEIPIPRKRSHSIIGRLRRAPQDLRCVPGDIPSLLKHELAFGKAGKPEIPKSGKPDFSMMAHGRSAGLVDRPALALGKRDAL